MADKKVFVTRLIPEEGLALLRARADVDLAVFGEDRMIRRDELLAAVPGCDAILSILTEKIDTEVLDAAGPQLKIVSNYAVGFDNIDLKAAAARKVLVTNTPGVLTEAVAEHTLGLMMAVSRRIPEAERYLRSGKYSGWGPMLLLGMELRGKTLGVVGTGRIGYAVALAAAKGLGMRIAYTDVRRNDALEKETGAAYFAKIDDLLPVADVVTIHVPLLPATKHLINSERLAKMKKTACLVNTSRGPVIEEAALVDALKRGVIGGAGLDVFENEPGLAPGLKELENAVVTPHIASATREARAAMARLAAQAILDVFDGKTPEHLVKT